MERQEIEKWFRVYTDVLLEKDQQERDSSYPHNRYKPNEKYIGLLDINNTTLSEALQKPDWSIDTVARLSDTTYEDAKNTVYETIRAIHGDGIDAEHFLKQAQARAYVWEQPDDRPDSNLYRHALNRTFLVVATIQRITVTFDTPVKRSMPRKPTPSR